MEMMCEKWYINIKKIIFIFCYNLLFSIIQIINILYRYVKNNCIYSFVLKLKLCMYVIVNLVTKIFIIISR